jgi:peptidoglycan/xylan/chitin deacetylase (PgdA/CDA1 family)
MLRVLTYHRIAPAHDSTALGDYLVSASADAFERQMRHLARHYALVSVQDVLEALRLRKQLPSHAVLVTFDDAYRDFATLAWPILKRFCAPVALFVATAYAANPGRTFWWDRLHHAIRRTSRRDVRDTPIGDFRIEDARQRSFAFQQLMNYAKTLLPQEAEVTVDVICRKLNDVTLCGERSLNWHELRQLAQEGVTIGAHTRNHAILPVLSSTAMLDEVVGAQQDIDRELGHALPIFCYPSGMHDARSRDVLKHAGIALAFATQDGHNDFRTADPLRLCRTSITPRTTPSLFALRLLRPVTYIDRWRHRKYNADPVQQMPGRPRSQWW